ncbi:hypothetical protein Tco_1259754, partial [Tanacetum coccineum]
NDSDNISDEGDDDNDGNSGNDDDDNDDANDEQEGDDTNDDDEDTDKEEKIDDEETMYDDEDDEVTKELYKDVNVNLGNEDTEMTNDDQGALEQQNVSQESGFEQVEEDAHVTLTLVLDTQKADEPVQSSSVSSDFTSKLLNLKNPSPADNEIASLMETSAHHATVVPEITSSFTPVTNLEKDLLEIKQVDQYAQDLSIPAIVDRYMDNKLGEAINKAIQAHNFDCREEAQAEKMEYIELVDSTKNATECLEIAVLTRYSSHPQSSYEVVATLFEFELIKILVDNIERNKSYDIADHKRELYDALVKSYQIDKDLFDSYGKVFSLKRSRDDRDKDRYLSAGSDRGTKRRKSSKDAVSSRDSSLPMQKVLPASLPICKGSQVILLKTHAHTRSSEFRHVGENAEQPACHAEVTKVELVLEKTERPQTPNPDWIRDNMLTLTSLDLRQCASKNLHFIDELKLLQLYLHFLIESS